jgi:hypothetical protein
MSLEDIYFISQIVAAIALIASLFFVGMQLRQTDKTQRAAMHQARARRQMDLSLRLAEPHNADLLSRIRLGETKFTPAEMYQLQRVFHCYAVDLIDIAWQNHNGMVDDNVAKISERTFSNQLSSLAFRAHWRLIRERFLPANRDRIDAIFIEASRDAGPAWSGWDDAVAAVMAETGKRP